MPLTALLAPERIALLADPCDRDSVLDAAARLLSDASPALAPGIARALRERERQCCTAIGCGVAIPHARGDAFDAPRGAFLRLGHAVDFGNGASPVDLVFALGVPEHSPELHLQALSELADHFSDARFRQALREARDRPALCGLLLGDAQSP
ncbi:PTS sugar transporter subunit IIA [Luteimonas aquatica]|uniref:PTS sugar transporter subunit IIA n=1 Tax=Luteimonas aquatica TaxID=450364 RepID=UPI001F572107|nr:PTS sugar transporter subunit IIA [Luteimonas aquatica]